MPRKFFTISNHWVKFRLSLGFDVRSFSDFLLISKSALAEVEKGERSLPAKALKYVDDLEKVFQKNNIIRDIKQEFVSVEIEKLNLYKQKEAKKITGKIIKLEFRLADMVEKYDTAISIIQNLSKVEAQTTGDLGKHHQNMLDRSAYFQHRKLSKIDATEQLKLSKKISALQMELELCTIK